MVSSFSSAVAYYLWLLLLSHQLCSASTQGVANNETISNGDELLNHNNTVTNTSDCTTFGYSSSVPKGFKEFYAGPEDIFVTRDLYRCSEDDGTGLLLCSWERVMGSCCKCSTGCCKDVCENITLADDVLAILTVQNCQQETNNTEAPTTSTTDDPSFMTGRPEDIEECQDTPGWNKYRGRQAPWGYRYFHCEDNDVSCDAIGNYGSAADHCCKCFPQCGGNCVQEGVLSSAASIGTLAFSVFVVAVSCFIGYFYRAQTSVLRETRRVMAERRRQLRQGNDDANSNDEVDMEERMLLILSRFHVHKVPATGLDDMFTPAARSSRSLRISQNDLQQIKVGDLNDLDSAPGSRRRDSAGRTTEEISSDYLLQVGIEYEVDLKDDEEAPSSRNENRKSMEDSDISASSSSDDRVDETSTGIVAQESLIASVQKEPSTDATQTPTMEDEEVAPPTIHTTVLSTPSSLASDDGRDEEVGDTPEESKGQPNVRRLSFAQQEDLPRRGSHSTSADISRISARRGSAGSRRGSNAEHNNKSPSHTRRSFLSPRRTSHKDEVVCQPVSPRGGSTRGSRRISRNGSRPSIFSSILWKKAACKDECSICLEPYLPGEVICLSRNEACNHVFHQECVVEWLKRDDRCPLCRVDLMAEVTPTQDE